MGSERLPPALPPRGPLSSLTSDDPRASSTQSLLSSAPPSDHERRKLLLIYIHGFMGAEASFNSFPSHVHNYLTLSLADSYVVHSKVYPRYKSKKQIQFARDDFSRWFRPHEDSTTDVVLLGHSMGGLLAAEIALMPAAPARSDTPFQHRLLGTINLDVPFLGMHPGIIGAGLASIFGSKPTESERSQAASNLTSPSTATLQSADGMSTASSTNLEPTTSNMSQVSVDPNFNPKFNNDVNLPIRKGWESALHFFNKHSNTLFQSSSAMIKSHMEFGGAMTDYSGLLKRYARIRALEHGDEKDRKAAVTSATAGIPRIRFVNYYTASTGRPKKNGSHSQNANEQAQSSTAQLTATRDDPEVESVASFELEEREGAIIGSFDDLPLPQVPPEPTPPPRINASHITDPDVRKVIERHQARLIRSYERDREDRMALIRDRAKLQQKYTRSFDASAGAEGPDLSRLDSAVTASTEQSISAAKEEASGSRGETEAAESTAADPPEQAPGEDGASHGPSASKKPKERTFCILPARDGSGQRDPAWVRVFMKDIDEVGAHCGLFVPGPTYEMLVGEVSQRIQDWALEDMSRRLVEGQAWA